MASTATMPATHSPAVLTAPRSFIIRYPFKGALTSRHCTSHPVPVRHRLVPGRGIPVVPSPIPPGDCGSRECQRLHFPETRQQSQTTRFWPGLSSVNRVRCLRKFVIAAPASGFIGSRGMITIRVGASRRKRILAKFTSLFASNSDRARLSCAMANDLIWETPGVSAGKAMPPDALTITPSSSSWPCD